MRKDIEDLHRQIKDLQYRNDNTTYELQSEHNDSKPAPDSDIPQNDGLTIRHATNKDDFEAAEEYKEEEETPSWDEIEKRSIRQALERHNGSRKLAANELKISERTLYRKIKEYDL